MYFRIQLYTSMSVDSRLCRQPLATPAFELMAVEDLASSV